MTDLFIIIFFINHFKNKFGLKKDITLCVIKFNGQIVHIAIGKIVFAALVNFDKCHRKQNTLKLKSK